MPVYLGDGQKQKQSITSVFGEGNVDSVDGGDANGGANNDGEVGDSDDLLLVLPQLLGTCDADDTDDVNVNDDKGT